ncbi:MAG: glycerophosphodiester phosphodiesterase, partial [Flavobacteriaceae bacterium]
GWALDQFLISSFNWETLREMRNMNQNIAIAVLTEGDPMNAIPIAQELNAVAINPDYKTLNQANIDAIHAAGLKVYTWTVNDPDEIEKLKKMGVDGIFSDYPERI